MSTANTRIALGKKHHEGPESSDITDQGRAATILIHSQHTDNPYFINYTI